MYYFSFPYFDFELAFIFIFLETIITFISETVCIIFMCAIHLRTAFIRNINIKRQHNKKQQQNISMFI